MMRILFLLMLIISTTSALTLEDIRSYEKSNKLSWADSMDIRASVTTEFGTLKTEASVHKITYGKEREYLEVKAGSMHHQKVLRNGEKVQTTDLIKKTTQVSKYDGELNKMSSAINTSFLDMGEWLEPEKDGDLWLIKDVVNSKKIWWDNTKARFVKMEQSIESGAVVESIIEYCNNCELKNIPSKIISKTVGAAMLTTHIITFDKVTKSSWLSESFFFFR